MRVWLSFAALVTAGLAAHHESRELNVGSLGSLFGNNVPGGADRPASLPMSSGRMAPLANPPPVRRPPVMTTRPLPPVMAAQPPPPVMAARPPPPLPAARPPSPPLNPPPIVTAPVDMNEDAELVVVDRTRPMGPQDDLIISSLASDDAKSFPPPAPTCSVDPKMTVTFQGRSYLFSWLQRSGRVARLNWNDAVNYCAGKCMNLVTVDSFEKLAFFGRAAAEADVYGFWTGAFYDETAWKWQSNGRAMDPKIFSPTGVLGRPQPDNYLDKASGGIVSELCAAVLNNWFNDGAAVHDMACLDKLPFICEKA